MNKFKSILKHSYLVAILLFLYIPIFFGVIYSFNEPSAKGVHDKPIKNYFQNLIVLHLLTLFY